MFEQQSAEETLKELHSSKMGLSGEEAAERLARDGANALPEKDPPTTLQRFLSPVSYTHLFTA